MPYARGKTCLNIHFLQFCIHGYQHVLDRCSHCAAQLNIVCYPVAQKLDCSYQFDLTDVNWLQYTPNSSESYSGGQFKKKGTQYIIAKVC